MEFGFVRLVAALLVLWMALEVKFTAVDTRLARMERLQQRIAEHHGMVLVDPQLEPVRALLIGPGRKRNRLAAIKKYREITGADLATAKAAVDRIDRGEPSSPH
ncbi:hypothetical protein [Nocardioides sp.]|uniref:hypothetical protein n=1 Tax=Nocardioides sp. TaxID=35761 RepID=UPI002C0AE0F5|nr:hypothetical protein [Nocardioides sp.]HXH78012.1 hypothetical protein [Nocardioides sp.]